MISEKAEKIIHDIPGRYYTIELDWKEVLAPITDYISTLESENARLKDAQRWIPVSERLPEANKCVLIYDAGGNMTVDILVKSGGVETYFWLPKYRILFWMPLPEPPEVK